MSEEAVVVAMAVVMAVVIVIVVVVVTMWPGRQGKNLKSGHREYREQQLPQGGAV